MRKYQIKLYMEASIRDHPKMVLMSKLLDQHGGWFHEYATIKIILFFFFFDKTQLKLHIKI